MKKRRLNNEHIVAIDVGTTKICVLIARAINEYEIEILGIGSAPSKGLARGIVVNIGPAMNAIKAAVQEAELMSGVKIESAVIGISGAHINAINSQGMIALKHKEVREEDIAQVIHAAQAISLTEGQQILHVIPQSYSIDGQHTVSHPLGMHGVRLETQVHIITGGTTSVQNLVRCCTMAGINVTDIVLEPLASAEAVLSFDEKEMGVSLLDIGGGTADFAFYQKGCIRHTRIFPIAGNLFTNDLALCLRTTREEGERVKREYGSVAFYENDVEKITLTCADGINMQEIYSSDIRSVLHPRAQELFEMIFDEMKKFNLTAQSSAGIVLSGGGSLLKGLNNLAEETLGIPARIGKPRIIEEGKQSLESPVYATSYGIALYALKERTKNSFGALSGPLVKRVFYKMKSWIADFF